MTRRWLRWIPAAVVPAVVVGGALALPMRAGAAVPLPERSPQEVLTLLAESDVQAFSGTIEQTSDLGFPSLPSLSGQDTGLGAGLEVLTADHTARVFADGPERLRLQVLDDLGERQLVLNGAEAWTYDFRENEATRLTLPADVKERLQARLNEAKAEAEARTTLTPAGIAERALAAIEPSTGVTTTDNVRVAGRSAYELVLTPETSDTLVGSVRIAVDSETGMPLRAAITARGAAEPAVSVAFTELSLATPEAELFAFAPPAGAEVTEKTLPSADARAQAKAHAQGAAPHDAAVPGEEPTVTGSGWSAVVALPAGAVPAEVFRSPLLVEATTEVAGGRALQTALFSVLLTEDGGALAGAVPVEQLQAAAAER